MAMKNKNLFWSESMIFMTHMNFIGDRGGGTKSERNYKIKFSDHSQTHLVDTNGNRSINNPHKIRHFFQNSGSFFFPKKFPFLQIDLPRNWPHAESTAVQKKGMI